MATSSRIQNTGHPLALEVRERFGRALDAWTTDCAAVIAAELDRIRSGEARVTRVDFGLAMEAATLFGGQRAQWMERVRRLWRQALQTYRDQAAQGKPLANLGLLDDEVVEGKIIASRLGASANDSAGSDWGDLRLRMQQLERSEELAPDDALRSETYAHCLIQAWTDCGLTRPMWKLVHAGVRKAFSDSITKAYQHANTWLGEHGVQAEIASRSRPRRDEPQASRTGPRAADSSSSERGAVASRSGHPPTAPAQPPGSAPRYRTPSDRAFRSPSVPTSPSTGWRGEVRPSALARADQETRMVTGMPPIARMRQRAQGILGQLRRMLSDHVSEYDTAGAAPAPPSPQLARALAEPASTFAMTELMERGTAAGAATQFPTAPSVDMVAARLRRRATELKSKAERPSEKAVIEIVALMFQAILAEERIPADIRIWFARLQIPVLRLALAEPDFFASVEHPARQLIDRMGSCALGFDATQVTDDRLRREIKRIVQVIEQYPETGRRVYQLVLDEFKKFLGRSLTEATARQHAATLAQRVEQKEALSVQYTIELRRMLANLPVPDGVREFLFRVWSDVLAMAAVRHGPQHADTLRLKQAAADLLWAVSAKPERTERARVVQQLPGLLHTLREGMDSLAVAADEQEAHIKLVNDAVMQAFVSRDDGLSPDRMAELSRSLAALEDVVTDDPEGDLMLDPGMIELMFGEDGAAVDVIAAGGSQPSPAMLDWARHLDLGAWFSLDQNGSTVQVQYAWRSARGQLHLLSASSDKTYLIQTQRLAAHLQAGLLVPLEDEALTVRATREALTRLQAQPAALLQ